MAVGYKHPRGTKANLDSLAGSSSLVVGQIYIVTDQGGRLAFATATNAYVFAQTRGVSGSFLGKPGNSEVVLWAESPYAFSITQSRCSVRASVAATAEAIFTLKNGASSVGTATFAAAGTIATVVISTPGVALNDQISLVGPSSADATLANLTMRFME